MSVGNPYIIDRPLSEADLFIGRHRLLVGVVQSLIRGRQLVLVYGPARMGKTSFLRRLTKELPAEYIVLSVDLVWPEGGNAERAMQELQARVTENLSTVLGQAAPDPSGSSPLGRSLEAEGSSPSGPSLTAALDALQDRVVILVDGLSVTDLCGEAGADLMTQWQEWMSSMSKVHFVVAVNGRPEGAALSNTALAALPSVELEGLTLEETEDLLAKPVKGRLALNFDAMRRVWQLTSGHPYFVQLFGHALFVAHSGRGRVVLHDVEEVIQDVMALGHSVMEGIWQRCSPQARVLLAVSNELRGRHGVLTTRDLHDAAHWQGVQLPMPAIEAGLVELLAVGVLRRFSADSYCFYTRLFHLWLAEHKALSQTLRDLKGYRRLMASRSSWLWRSFRWSTVALCLAALAMVTAVVVLWNMRGAGQRLVVGSLPTASPSLFATRATLVSGPTVGRIAYMAKDNPDANWDIWVMRGDGSDPKRLTDDPADDMAPTWSPDGRYVAFVSDRDGNKEIYVMKADGTQQINLTHHSSEDWTPAWSPDGSSIAFSSYREGNWEIYIMGSDGTDPRRLTQDSAADYGPCWSPDSQQIAFNSNRDGNWEIYVIGRDGTGLLRLTVNEATDFAPAWSPDGMSIAFESYRDGNMEIYLMAADGSGQQDISNDHYSNEHGPVWARRGTRLLYFSNRDGGWDIFSMKPDGTEKNNLTLSPASEQGLAWHE